MTTTDIEKPSDYVFKSEPFQHQLAALARSRDERVFALLMEQGTGKSKVIVDTAGWLFSRGRINGLVIIAPKSVCKGWVKDQLSAHMPDSIRYRSVLWDSNTKKFQEALRKLYDITPLELHVLVMNYDAVNTDRGYDELERFLRAHDTLLVLDESTAIANHSAQRTKIITKLGKLARYRRIMTGTPMSNRPLDFYSQFRFLDDELLGSSSFVAFRNRYAVTQTRYVNGRKFEEITGWQRLDELQRYAAASSFRVLKKDCLDLPEKVYETRYIELDAEQRRYYEEMRQLSLAQLSNGGLVSAPLVITQLLRLRQALCNIAVDETNTVHTISETDNRLNELVNVISEAGDQKFIIWSSFTPAIRRIHERLTTELGVGKVATFFGETKASERQDLIDQMNDPSNQLRGLVMQPATGGVGITVTGATLQVFHDHNWSLVERLQAEDRSHRIGQKHNVTYVDLVAPNTIEEQIVAALRRKQDLADVVTGDALKRLLTVA